MKKSVLILGANSDIGLAIARCFAVSGYSLALAARNITLLQREKSDIELRHGVDVSIHHFDILDNKMGKRLINEIPSLPEIVICCTGFLGNHNKDMKSVTSIKKVIRINFEGPVNILSLFANKFEQRGSGTIVGISSVAGMRGRKSNYIYGAAKSGLSTFLSGLRNRLHNSGVHVVTVHPGFVDTKMTAHIKLPKKLTASPEKVAKAVLKAVIAKKNTVFILPIWKIIMFLISVIPESIFKRLSL